MKKYKVAFLILNYKTYEDTLRLVGDIKEFEGFGKDYCVIVVDNNSPNESFDELSKKLGSANDVFLLKSNENGGYAKGNNIGLRFMSQTPPDFVCIVNNDVYFKEQTIRNLIETYGKLDSPAMMAPLQRFPNGELHPCHDKIETFWEDVKAYFPLHIRTPKPQPYKANTKFDNIQEVEFVPGAFLFVDYKRFQSIGFFDERTFLFGEERITAKKVKDAGMRNYLILDDEYIHDHSKTIDNERSIRQQYKLFHQCRVIYARHYRSHPRIKVFILHVCYYAGMPLRRFRRGVKKIIRRS